MKHRTFLLTVLFCLLLCAPALAVEFTDCNGRTIEIDNPQRVVSLYNSYGDAWMLAGGKLVGTIADTFEDADAETMADVQNLGNHMSPNMELLFSLNPDFVILAGNVATHAEIGATLEQAGIPHAYFFTPDWRGYMETFRIFTQITGREDLYLNQLETVQKPIEALIAEAESSEHFGQTTALLLRANSTNVKARNSERSVAGSVLNDMGFVNLADSESPLSESLSLESILIEDPDFIFVITAGSDTEAAMSSLRTALTDNPAWNTLTAVRDGRFFILDRELFHYHPNDRWAESYAFIAGLLD